MNITGKAKIIKHPDFEFPVKIREIIITAV
jgi:hypothetical protein